jgi:hypothetical protein
MTIYRRRAARHDEHEDRRDADRCPMLEIQSRASEIDSSCGNGAHRGPGKVLRL